MVSIGKKNLNSCTVFFTFLLAIIFPPIIWAQDIRPVVMNNVVLVFTKNESGIPEIGFGLIVARVLDVLWIATAKHVVIWPENGPEGQLKYSNDLSIKTFGNPKSYLLAGKPKVASSKLDLVFFPVLAPLASSGEVESWRYGVLDPQPRDGEELRIAGTEDHTIGLGSSRGRIDKSFYAKNIFSIGVPGLTGKEGQSGAPVVSASGIVGMYISTSPRGPGFGQIVPISVVRKAAEDLVAPWQLTNNLDASSSARTRICVRHIGAERPDIRISPNAIVTSNPAGSCTEVVGLGTKTITAMDSDILCLPEKIVLRSEELKDLVLNCMANPSGYWINAPLGGAQVIADGSDAWSFRGLPLGVDGQITGRLTGSSSLLMFDGETSKKDPVVGSAKVTKGEFSLDLIVASRHQLRVRLTRP